MAWFNNINTLVIVTAAGLGLTASCGAVQTTEDQESSVQVSISSSTADSLVRRYSFLGKNPLPRTSQSAVGALPQAIKNFRVVIPGILYRGGVKGRRGFNKEELKSLCEQGFSKAVYFYDRGFTSRVVNCKTPWGSTNTLSYIHRKTTGTSGLKKLMKEINSSAVSNKGPVYMHCHNGWHATGIASAVAAIQFCGMDRKQAVSYMKYTTDGSYDTIKGWAPKKVKRFPVSSALAWDAPTKSKLCKDLIEAGNSL